MGVSKSIIVPAVAAAISALAAVGVVAAWSSSRDAEGAASRQGRFALSQISESPTQIRFQCQDRVQGGATPGRGRGAAFLDYNLDGWMDVVYGNMDEPAMLLENLGDGSFNEVPLVGLGTEKSYGIAVGDYNLDGYPDIYLGRGGKQHDAVDLGSDPYFCSLTPWIETELSPIEAGSMPNVLLENRGGTFVDVTEHVGVGDAEQAWAVRFVDYDLDGRLDIYVANYGARNVLYRNDGDGAFTDMTEWAGVEGPLFSMDAVWADYDDDGYPDLFVTGVSQQDTSSIYRNNGDGTFTDMSSLDGIDPLHGGIAAAFADLDSDGVMDLYVAVWNDTLDGETKDILGQDWWPGSSNRVYFNKGDGTFRRVERTGAEYLGGSHSVTTGDFNNDGFLDLYISTGGPEFLLEDKLYQNNGDGTFSDVTTVAGIREIARGHGVVTGDYDGDGRLDIYVSSGGMNYVDMTANVMCRNVGEVGNWLAVELDGEGRAVQGARVTVVAEGTTQTSRIGGGAGFGSVNSPIAHFGLGDRSRIELVTVRWPDGFVQELEAPPVNATAVIRRR